MNPLWPRILFRVRERLDAWLVAAPRSVFWRVLGMRVGRGTRLPEIFVTWPHQVSFGERCSIERHSYFKFDGTYRPGPRIVFDDDVFIGMGCEFNIRVGLQVGKHCLVASGCYFVDHDHGFSTRAMPMALQQDGTEAPIVLEDDVWLGAHVVVLKGVTIGRGAVVAAGSVVNRSIGPHEIWGGVPARKLRERPLGAVDTFSESVSLQL